MRKIKKKQKIKSIKNIEKSFKKLTGIIEKKAVAIYIEQQCMARRGMKSY